MGKREHSGNPAAEAADLHSAMAKALAELQKPLAGSTEEAADSIGFQIAMLEDPALAAPCWHLISNHASADGAWSSTLDQQVEIFNSSGDESFRARSSDVEDIRDRVLRHLAEA